MKEKKKKQEKRLFIHKILHQTSKGLEQSRHLPSVFQRSVQGKQSVASVLYLAHWGCSQPTPKQRGHPGVAHCTFYQKLLFSWWQKKKFREMLLKPKSNSLPLLPKAYGLAINWLFLQTKYVLWTELTESRLVLSIQWY